MSKISKPFVIATEGPTIDGRNISREWIQQMAANYDPKAYTAVANIEHILSLLPDGLFSACGKVVSLGTQKANILGEEKLQLTAVVEVDDAIAALQKAGKKAFCSMEVAANFASKGFAYLTGLAFTDKPASLGTESMKFSAGKDNVYSFANEIEVEFEAAQEKPGDSLLSRVKGMLVGKDKKTDERFAESDRAIETIAAAHRDLMNQFAELTDRVTASVQRLAELETKTIANTDAFTAFKASLDAQPAGTPRPAAAGGNVEGLSKTDC